MALEGRHQLIEVIRIWAIKKFPSLKEIKVKDWPQELIARWYYCDHCQTLREVVEKMHSGEWRLKDDNQ
jgi:hypothetical protein